MKNTLLLITIIFSFNAFGADKPKTEFDKQGNLVTDIGAVKYSPTGLEGWGKKIGTYIEVRPDPKIDKNFPIKSIETKVELRLRQSGIKVANIPTADTPPLLVDIYPVQASGETLGYWIVIRAKRLVKFEALDINGKMVTYEAMASNKRYGGIAPHSKLIPFIDSLMDDFLLDHIKANPKKEK